MCVFAPVHRHREARGGLHASAVIVYFILLRQGLSLELGKLANPLSPVSAFPSTAGIHTTMSAFLVGAGGLNSGPKLAS